MAHQLTPAFSLGIEGGYINGLASFNDLGVAYGRLHAKLSLLNEHLALVCGVGGEGELQRGVGHIATTLTADLGVTVGRSIGSMELYGGVAGKFGQAVWPGRNETFGIAMNTEAYLCGGVGLALRPGARWRLAAEIDPFITWSNVKWGIGVAPTLSATYVFGGR